MAERVALVAGVTGIVGLSLVELLAKEGGWRVYGIARRPRPSWLHPAQFPLANYIQCDLLDRELTMTKLSILTDVTHLFFVTWASRDSEEENVAANASMLRNTLDGLLPSNSATFKHVCLQTGSKHYLGSFYTWSRYDGHDTMPFFHEDLPRAPGPNFYYAQEDILQELADSSNGSISWSVHRAGLITGFSPNAIVNISFALAAYACICKYDTESPSPFVFPGPPRSWESHAETSDSHLIAEQEIWAASQCLNQKLNIVNGDTVTWQALWPSIAQFFKVEPSPYEGETISLVETLKTKQHVWESVVSKYELHPTRWEDVLLGLWCLDLLFQKLPPYKMSMQKSVKLGFLASRSTQESFLYSFERMRQLKIIP